MPGKAQICGKAQGGERYASPDLSSQRNVSVLIQHLAVESVLHDPASHSGAGVVVFMPNQASLAPALNCDTRAMEFVTDGVSISQRLNSFAGYRTCLGFTSLPIHRLIMTDLRRRFYFQDVHLRSGPGGRCPAPAASSFCFIELQRTVQCRYRCGPLPLRSAGQPLWARCCCI